MNKPTKIRRIALAKDTVKKLTANDLGAIVGGRIPATNQSHCVTFCTNC